MRSVIVQPPHATCPAELLELSPGQSIRFGRGAPELRPELILANEAVSRLAGQITATDEYWTLTNFSRDATYVVENPEGSGELVKAPPLRLGMPIPFEIARVVLPAGTGFVYFQVYAPMHSFLDPRAPAERGGELTVASFPMDTSAKYFLVLLALCEPRLRDESYLAIPTAEAVVERLRPLPACRTLTVAAVNFHIDYLARTKLRVKQPGPDGRSERLDTKREALVSVALRFDLVREEHLAMLPPRRPAPAHRAGSARGAAG
jgi:hypothetical protein